MTFMFCVLEKEIKQPTYRSAMPYAVFLISEGFNRKPIEGFSFGYDTQTNFGLLEKGFTYLARGDISRRQKDERFHGRSKSEQDRVFIFGEIEVLAKIQTSGSRDWNPNRELYADDITTIDQITEFLDEGMDFRYRLVKDVVLSSAEIYYYDGCGRCQKSRPNETADEYICTSCGFTTEKQSSLFFKDYNITVRDRASGKELDSIVCFNDETEKLFRSTGPETSPDRGLQDVLEEIIGSTVSLRLSRKMNSDDVIASSIQLGR